MRAIVKTGDTTEEVEIPPDYIQRKPPLRREEAPMIDKQVPPTHLRQTTTGRIYVYRENLAGRPDMEAYEMPVIIPPEELDELMEEAVKEDEKPAEEFDRKGLVKLAISKILPEEYSQAIGKRPPMPKVSQVSELAGFKVSLVEIAEALEG